MCLALVLAGCRRRDAGYRDNTVTILYPGGDQVLGLPEDDSPKQLVFLPLVTIDERGAIVGQLLRSWERHPGTNTWIYHLRADVRWHDGVPTTADDVAFTLEMMADPEINWLTPGRFDVIVHDDTTFSVTYRVQTVGGLLHLDDWQVYFPKHLLDTLDRRRFGDWDFWKRPVGNGPYRFVRSQPRTMIELAANPDYYAGKPKIDRVVLRLGEPSLPPLLSGEADLMPIRPLEALKLRGDPRFEVRHEVSDMRIGLVWNLRHPLFADVAVRRALTMAIDRTALAAVLNLPPDLAITDGIYTRHMYHAGRLPPALQHDPERARRLLDSLGWSDRDGDGIRERGGRPFRFTATTTLEGEQAAVYVQDQLRKVGVAMEVERVEGGVAVRRLVGGDQAAGVQRVRNSVRGRLGLIAMLGPQAFTGYRNEQVIDLLRRLEHALELEEIDSLYGRISGIVAADLPVTFLTPLVGSWAFSRRVRGLGAFVDAAPFEQIEHLWLDGVAPR